MSSFETQFVHGGRKPTEGEAGWHAPPIDFSTTYPIPNAAEAAQSLTELAFGAPSAANPVYARLHNPTVARFEDAMAQVEHGVGAVAFSTGMAAVTACLLAARQFGGHIVAVRPMYGGTDHLLSSGFAGFDVTFCEEAEIAASLREDTVLVIVETPANPTLSLVDIAAAAKAAGDVPLLVDSTFATPVLQTPLDLGATLVLHSATKYIGGHGDVMGGVVATSSEEWAAALRSTRATTGAILHPFAGYLLHRGLQTLPVRIAAAQHSAGTLADRLVEHPAVTRVHYPRMNDPRGLIGTQMRGSGAMVAFEIAGLEAARSVMESVGLITAAVSLGSTDTLIQHPASLTHQLVEEEVRESSGVSQGLLRLSVGLESVEDLWEDLEAALPSASSATIKRRRRRGAQEKSRSSKKGA